MKLGSRRSGAVSVLIWAYAYSPTRRSGLGVAADCARMKPPPRRSQYHRRVSSPSGTTPPGYAPSYSHLCDDPPGLADVSPLRCRPAGRGASAPCVTNFTVVLVPSVEGLSDQHETGDQAWLNGS